MQVNAKHTQKRRIEETQLLTIIFIHIHTYLYTNIYTYISIYTIHTYLEAVP